MLVAEQIVGVNLGAEHKLNALQIARAEIKLLVQLAAALDQQCGLARLELVQRGAEELGLGLGNFERIDNGELAVGNLRSDRRAQRAHQLLLRERILVAARLRSVDRTATTPERSADRTNAGTASSLLLPELLAGTRDVLASLRCSGSLTQRCAVVLYRLPQQPVVDLAGEDLVQRVRTHRPWSHRD